ncbi:MAG: 50S ribosomal protein L29 [Anaerolineae bacterium]|jgi:large subunit ribosomal protein L29|nr:50S ribosomal protein L29 [Anaerolineae bacterium]
MLANKLRELTTDELRLRLHQARQELFNLRQQWYAGSLEDPNVMREARKDIARILTLVHERDLAVEMGEGGGAA